MPILRTIADLTTRIVEFERRIEQIATERYPETIKLRKVNGVGAITSLTFVLTLEDPKRFTKSRAVGAFLGLRPGRNQSGKRDPELHITKAGDRDMRRLLVQSAQYILGPFGSDCDLRRFGLALAARGDPMLAWVLSATPAQATRKTQNRALHRWRGTVPRRA